jgi:hypothetical protein
MRVEKVTEPFKHLRIKVFWLWHEIGPKKEGTGDVATVLSEDRQFLSYDFRVVATPHARPTGARPVIYSYPRTPLAKLRHASPKLLVPARTPVYQSTEGYARRPAVNPS